MHHKSEPGRLCWTNTEWPGPNNAVKLSELSSRFYGFWKASTTALRTAITGITLELDIDIRTKDLKQSNRFTAAETLEDSVNLYHAPKNGKPTYRS